VHRPLQQEGQDGRADALPLAAASAAVAFEARTAAPASSRAVWAEREAGREPEAAHASAATFVYVMEGTHDYLQSFFDSLTIYRQHIVCKASARLGRAFLAAPGRLGVARRYLAI
jgi:hypothetical protein